MDTEKIAKLIEIATEAVEELERGEAQPAEAIALQWRVMDSCAQARAIAGAARVRAPEQMLIRRLIVEECERMVRRLHNRISHV